MFSRTDLFRIRDALVETFHTTTSDAERRKAFDRIWKINVRLLRADRLRMRRPDWSAV